MIYLIYEPIKMSCMNYVGLTCESFIIHLYLGGLLKMERCFVLPFYNNFTG